MFYSNQQGSLVRVWLVHTIRIQRASWFGLTLGAPSRRGGNKCEKQERKRKIKQRFASFFFSSEKNEVKAHVQDTHEKRKPENKAKTSQRSCVEGGTSSDAPPSCGNSTVVLKRDICAGRRTGAVQKTSSLLLQQTVFFFLPYSSSSNTYCNSIRTARWTTVSLPR